LYELLGKYPKLLSHASTPWPPSNKTKRGNTNMETIDEILANLKKDPNHYNHGMTEAMWMQECNRDD